MTVWSLKYLEDSMKAGMHNLIDIISYHGYKSVPERHTTQDVYAVDFKMDRRTCGENWMYPDPEADGIRHFKPLPISTSPLILTDRSVIDIVE